MNENCCILCYFSSRGSGRNRSAIIMIMLTRARDTRVSGFLVAPTEAAARSDLQSGRTEYKDLQSDYRIANANTHCDWIANPVESHDVNSHAGNLHERPAFFHERPAFFCPRPWDFYERPAFFHERPAFFCPRPWDFYERAAQENFRRGVFHLAPPLFSQLSSLHPSPSTKSGATKSGATKNLLTRVSRARMSGKDTATFCVECFC